MHRFTSVLFVAEPGADDTLAFERAFIAGLMIGNTAETIREGFACSVLAVKPPGFRAPIEA